jgi:hypothetical protein
MIKLRLEKYCPYHHGEIDELISILLALTLRFEGNKDKSKLQDVILVLDSVLKEVSSINQNTLISIIVTLRSILKNSLFSDNYCIWLWQCAQNMSYPDFYQAWHSSCSTDTKLLTE